MSQLSTNAAICLIVLVGCSGRGCRGRDDTAEDCAESDKQAWYDDADGDGHGDPLSQTFACSAPAGHVAAADDCEDGDPDHWERQSLYQDGDGDGFGAGSAVQTCEGTAGYADNADDCDDQNGDAWPDAPVTCGDGIDQDCDGYSDCDAPTGTASANQADARIGAGEGGGFGAALASADIDGDGLMDLAVGAPQEEGTGAAYVLYGPVTGGYSSAELDVHVVGNGEDMAAGTAVAVGDVDADGDLDLVIGAPDGDYAQGGISTYLVSSPLPTLVTLDGETDQDVLRGGSGTSLIADWDYQGDDGISDILVGAGNKGVVRIKEGPVKRSIDFTDKHDGRVVRGWTGLGQAMAILGDVTGDGLPDLGVGAPQGGTGDEVIGEFGNFYLISDPAVFQEEDEDIPFWSAFILGEAEEDGQFGWSIATVGDQDGDGLADVAVGAPGLNSGAGAVYLYSGDALSHGSTEEAIPAEDALAKISAANRDMQLGYALSADDADSDGTPDLAVGAPGDDDERGATSLWYGPLLDDVESDDASYTLTGEADGDRFGAAVNLAGDFNALGWPDLVVGATGVNDGDGAVYLFFMDAL